MRGREWRKGNWEWGLISGEYMRVVNSGRKKWERVRGEERVGMFGM